MKHSSYFQCFCSDRGQARAGRREGDEQVGHRQEDEQEGEGGESPLEEKRGEPVFSCCLGTTNEVVVVNVSHS